MKYYRLIRNFNNYGFYKPGVAYSEDVDPSDYRPLRDILNDSPSRYDWEEISYDFKFGRKIFDN
jgi:hypothetical protein